MKIMCQMCSKPVAFWSSARDVYRDRFKVIARCHGDLDVQYVDTLDFICGNVDVLVMFDNKEKEQAK